MATAAQESRGLVGFLKSALTALADKRLLVPVLLLAVVLTASNIVILKNMPAQGAAPGLAFAVAAAVRVLGLLVLAVAILRILNAGPRRPYMPDAGFWLYFLTFLLSLAVTVLARRITGAGNTLGVLLLTNAITALLLAPLAAWFVALAVVKPVPWSPARWMRAMPAWLPQSIFWTFLIVTPLAALHALIDLRLVDGAGEAFWPLALVDGPLSAVMALVGLALASEAYRRVAQS